MTVFQFSLHLLILLTGAISALFCVYHGYVFLRGAFKPLSSLPKAEPGKRIAVIIPARNEEKVIGKLVDSLLRQNYPSRLYRIWVAVNQCSDRTEQFAEAAGAGIIRVTDRVTCKGDVLRFCFQALSDAGEDYEGYLILDADNLADPQFLQTANDALCAGYDVCQSYRDSKNPKGSCWSGCMSVFFWFMSDLYNRCRSAIGYSVPLNGTGILISDTALQKLGYRTETLTEDLEFTAQCALAGLKIGYLPDALTYDEQPLRFRDTFIQRRRWAAGAWQCFKKYGLQLLKNAVRNVNCRDVLFQLSGIPYQMLSLIPGICTFLLMAVRGEITIAGMLLCLLLMLLITEIGGLIFVFIIDRIGRTGRKPHRGTWIAMGLFMLTWIPANLLALFTRPPKWVIIPRADNSEKNPV